MREGIKPFISALMSAIAADTYAIAVGKIKSKHANSGVLSQPIYRVDCGSLHLIVRADSTRRRGRGREGKSK